MSHVSDPLVFFGATGDTAYKNFFPALQPQLARGIPDMQVSGVARPGCSHEQIPLCNRARGSVEHDGGVQHVAIERVN